MNADVKVTQLVRVCGMPPAQDKPIVQFQRQVFQVHIMEDPQTNEGYAQDIPGVPFGQQES
jgi:hypothetical protein